MWEFPLHSGNVLVERRQSYGVVGTVVGKLECFVCLNSKCIHVKGVNEVLKEDTERDGILSDIACSIGDNHMTPEATLDPLSSEPIPVHAPARQHADAYGPSHHNLRTDDSRETHLEARVSYASTRMCRQDEGEIH